MKIFTFAFLFALLFPVWAYPGTCPFTWGGDGWGYDCIFYGGDFDPNHANANGLSNETDATVSGTPYGAATYQNFVSDGYYSVAGLFTSNLSTLNPQSGYWEIRSGVFEGFGGTMIASGTAAGTDFVHTLTGRSGFGYDEYIDVALGMSVRLTPGKYWFAVVPNDPDGAGRSYNSNTFGLNSIGTQVSDQQYFNSAFFATNFTNANSQGIFPTFSSGALYIWIPEPSSLTLVLTGLLTFARVVHRRLAGQGEIL